MFCLQTRSRAPPAGLLQLLRPAPGVQPPRPCRSAPGSPGMPSCLRHSRLRGTAIAAIRLQLCAAVSSPHRRQSLTQQRWVAALQQRRQSTQHSQLQRGKRQTAAAVARHQVRPQTWAAHCRPSWAVTMTMAHSRPPINSLTARLHSSYLRPRLRRQRSRQWQSCLPAAAAMLRLPTTTWTQRAAPSPQLQLTLHWPHHC